MNWVDILLSTLASSSIFAVTLVILGFIAKSLFSQILSKDLENHKLKLESEVEELRANLEKASIEHQIRFESLHSRRAAVIDEVYRLIVQLESEVSSMARPFQRTGEQPQSEKYIEANEFGRELINYYSQKRIYFREDLCNQIDVFINGLNEILSEFVLVINALEANRNHMNMTRQWIDSWDRLNNEIEPIKSEIENEFRVLIGIKDAN
jgi:hypothetical protein